VQPLVRADASREAAVDDGFEPGSIDDAGDHDVVCVLVPDDVIPMLGISPRSDALVIVASGYTLAFDRFDPACDVGMVAPRMLGPEVRRCYEEGVGFISAVGVHRDETGNAMTRTIAVAKAIGALRQGAIEMTPMQEAVLDLAVEQALAPALRRVSQSFVEVMLERGIPLEAILCELFLSGEVERTYRLLRLEGYAAQMEHHSPTSQYGQLSRGPKFETMEPAPLMRDVVEDIASGRFADEWDEERDNGHPTLARLKSEAMPPEIVEWEAELRSQLGERVSR
jgi:ketol-acid reductoisomerase